MKGSMKRSWVAACLAAPLLVASACVVGANPDPASPAEPRPAEPVSASFTPAPSSGVDISIAARPVGAPRALLIDDDGSGLHLLGRPIDPLTLGDVPGYTPISFGHHYLARTSPDGSTVVAILWPSGSSNGGATIHVIDTKTWADRELRAKVDTYTSALYFDDLGRTVYWTQPTAITPTTESANALFGLDVASGSVREIARFAEGYSARDLRVVGSRIAVWLVPTSLVAIDGHPRDVPRVALVAATGGIDGMVSLPAIRAGQVVDAIADDPYRSIEPGLAWDLPRGRLYVADAESDRIFTVDLRSGGLTGPVVPTLKKSLLDVVWSLFGSVAEAKTQSSTRQEAALSADGRWLYVSGIRSDFVKSSDGKLREVVTPIELRVIDPTDMSLHTTVDAATTLLWPAPSATRLLYATSRVAQVTEGYADRLDWRLHVADAAVSKDFSAVAFDGAPWLLAFDVNRGIAYLESQPSGNITFSRAAVLAIDLIDGHVIARRDLDRHYADMILLTGP
jgi:hypothetical protein